MALVVYSSFKDYWQRSHDILHITNVDKVSTRFEYFASGFTYIVELTLIQVKVDAEFDAESNDDIFGASLRSKVAFYHKILIFSDFCAKYLASGFAILAELSLKVVEVEETKYFFPMTMVKNGSIRRGIFC